MTRCMIMKTITWKLKIVRQIDFSCIRAGRTTILPIELPYQQWGICDRSHRKMRSARQSEIKRSQHELCTVSRCTVRRRRHAHSIDVKKLLAMEWAQLSVSCNEVNSIRTRICHSQTSVRRCSVTEEKSTNRTKLMPNSHRPTRWNATFVASSV